MTVQAESQQQSFAFSIYRFDPDRHDKPFMQDFTLSLPQGQEIMLLDALLLLKQQDETLAFRRSCGEGVCGSDGMQINGRNGLACITPLSSLKQPVVLRPLPSLPVVRDLIVDMTSFYKQYERVKPYLQNRSEPPAGERLQSPDEVEQLDGLWECILCACCSTSCPSFWWKPEQFLGPAALLWAFRFLVDTRDDARQERLEALDDPFSVFRCHGIMNCVESCPKHLNPTAAIAGIRSLMLKEGT